MVVHDFLCGLGLGARHPADRLRFILNLVIEILNRLLPVSGYLQRIGQIGLPKCPLYQQDIVGVIFDQ